MTGAMRHGRIENLSAAVGAVDNMSVGGKYTKIVQGGKS